MLSKNKGERSTGADFALPPKADIAERDWDVREVPQADMAPLVDDLVRELLSFGIHSYCLTKPPMLNQQHS